VNDVKKVRVFVASPSDMSPERERVQKVVSRLNQSTALGLGMFLEFTDWSTYVRPEPAARPEDAILEQLPVESWDVFIGLLWLKFGSPTGATDPTTGLPYASGTQEEFILAYQSWQQRQRPMIMMYRCERGISTINEIKPEQLKAVNDFFAEFAPLKRHPGLYQTFKETDELEREVESHLAALLFKQKQVPPVVEPPKTTGRFVAGEGYQITALAIEIGSFRDIVKKHGDKKVSPALKAFKDIVQKNCPSSDWEQVSWMAGGGVLATSGADMYDQTVIAGIGILTELNVYNLNPKNEIKFRAQLAAADGSIVWDGERSSTDVVLLADQVVQHLTDPGSFSITDKVYGGLADSLKKEFNFRRRFEEHRILGYPPATAVPRRAMPNLVAEASEDLQQLAGLSISDAITGVDLAYGQLEEFSQYFEMLDDRWSVSYVRQIDAWATQLLDAEKAFWDSVQANFGRAAGTAEQARWKEFADIVRGRRAAVLVPLGHLKTQTQLAGARANKTAEIPLPEKSIEKNIESITAAHVSPELEAKIQKLIDADEMEEEVALADLLATARDGLIAGVSANAFGDLREPLLNRLWSLSDLILIDELRDERNGLFAALLKNPVTRPRYGELTRILSDGKPLSEASVRERFVTAGLPFTKADLEVIWRSTLVGVTNTERLILALMKIPVAALWRTMASPNIRVSALYAMAQRFKLEPSDQKKIFFDCIHTRLMREVQSNGSDLAFVGRMLSIFFADELFVQSPYFERLDDLLLNFRRSDRSGADVELFESLAEKLKKVRIDRDNPEAGVPAGIESLPLPVQRHLAAEGRYTESFVLHPDGRIAKEAGRFITMSNVERVMGYRQINEQVLHMLLQRKEFFIRRSTLLVALQHPKCTVEFARLNLVKAGALGWQKVADNPGANPAVRAIARSHLQSH